MCLSVLQNTYISLQDCKDLFKVAVFVPWRSTRQAFYLLYVTICCVSCLVYFLSLPVFCHSAVRSYTIYRYKIMVTQLVLLFVCTTIFMVGYPSSFSTFKTECSVASCVYVLAELWTISLITTLLIENYLNSSKPLESRFDLTGKYHLMVS